MANLATGYALDGTAKTYTTLADAFTPASNNDNLQIHYADANKTRVWKEPVARTATTKLVNFEGMIANRGVSFCGSTDHEYLYYAHGDLSAGTTQLAFKNFTVIGMFMVVHWQNTGASASGGGFKLENVLCIGCSSALHLIAGEDDYDIVNCCFINSFRPMSLDTDQAVTCVNSTFVGVYLVYLSSTLSTFINCVFSDVLGFHSATNTTWNNCVFSGSGPLGTKNNCHTSQTWDTLAFWGDEMVNGGGATGQDYRVTNDSFLIGEGTPTGAPATDCDGTTRANPPTVGWHEGTPNPYEYPGGGSEAPFIQPFAA